MTTVYTNYCRSNVVGAAWTTINLRFYQRALGVAPGLGLETLGDISQLEALPGWLQLPSPTPYAGVAFTAVTHTTTGSNIVYYAGAPAVVGLTEQPGYAVAVAAYLPSGQVLYVSNTAFGNGSVGVTIIPGTQVHLGKDGTGAEVLFSVNTSSGASATYIFSDGFMQFSVPPGNWESARQQQAWLVPHRVNYLMNPSFENSGIVGWRTNGTYSQISGGIGGDVRHTKAGHFVPGAASRLVVESNLFPPSDSWFSAGIHARGNGRVRCGITFWDEDMLFPEYSAGNWYNITSAGYSAVWAIVRTVDDSIYGQMRIEFEGDSLDLDQCIVDYNEAQFPYFDGETIDAPVNDCGWYGGESAIHQSYSTYYQNRDMIRTRMFGYIDGDSQHVPGIANDWVPSSIEVVPVWDTVSPRDVPFQIPERSADGLRQPYRPVENLYGSAVAVLSGFDVFRPSRPPLYRTYQFEVRDISLVDANCAWDYGDGTTGTGVSVSHTYVDKGLYQVALTVSGVLDSVQAVKIIA